MSNVRAFTIGGVTYNAAMASAVQQDELLGLITAPVIERFLVVAKQGSELGDNVLAPMFMAMNKQVKDRIAGLLMARVFVHGTDTAITVADFGGKIVQYNTLLAQLLRWNLSDFFDWLPSVLDGAQGSNDEAPSTGT
jgi:hypothetical protein